MLRTRIGSVLVAVNIGDVYAQERIRDPRLLRPIRKIAVDDDSGDEREDDAVFQGIES